MDSKMNRTHILVLRNKLPGLKYAEDQTVVTHQKKLVKNVKFKTLRLKVYGHIVETIISTLVVFISLAIYKITGLHALWVQLVSKLV